MGSTLRAASVAGAAVALVLSVCAAPAAAEILAGTAVVDATYHVGASAGQYASDHGNLVGEFDPSVQSVLKAPSYGVQSRLKARAIVIQRGTEKFAIVRVDLYIPQDLLWRRTAQILEADGTGIGRNNLVMTITHDHSSPFYTSTGAGAWTFQDIFDIRNYEYQAERMAAAVEAANRHLVPVRVGAAVTQVAAPNRNALGPAVADDGTPAGFPDAYTNRDLDVIRFDDISDPAHPKPLANLVDWSAHGEGLDGNDLISADWIGPMERMLDDSTGATTIFTQNSVGNTELERNSYHSIHDRFMFNHAQYGQAEYNGGIMAKKALALFKSIPKGKSVVPFFDDGKVAFADHWFPGPLTHQQPTVSNCRTDQVFSGDPRLPIVGLPDCETLSNLTALSPADLGVQNPGISIDALRKAGIPIPDNISGGSFGLLEEDLDVHLQAFRVGNILFTVCSCEQWADQAKNIQSRTDRIAGDEWLGFDWASYRGIDDTLQPCFWVSPYDGKHWSCPHPDKAKTAPCAKQPNGTYSCPDPSAECLLKGPAFTNTCRTADPKQYDRRLPPIPAAAYNRMVAEVRNCANGWNGAGWSAYAESEPPDPVDVKGNYSCDDTQRSADLGYALTVPIGMANDYNGYIATFREYERGDHYRKALTGWGPHSSDYMATRLVKLGRMLNDGPPLNQTLDGKTDPDADSPLLAAKTEADLLSADARAQALGVAAKAVITAYGAIIPDDAGTAQIVSQPKDIQRFDAAITSWRGGDNYVDNPTVSVQRRVKGGGWQTYADQDGGRVVTTVKFPSLGNVTDYLAGNQQWIWTATFEAYVSRYALPATDRATPPDTYRFVIEGQRQLGHKSTAYHLESQTFTVSPWSGITADAIKVQRSGKVAVQIGPRHEVSVPGGKPDKATLGPIDYPDSYAGAAGAPRFIKHVRTLVRDPAAPSNPSLFEWYCLNCSFRPWMDTGNAKTVTLTFMRKGRHPRHVKARRHGDLWVTGKALPHGWRARVSPGAIRDAYGDRNGAPSATVRRQ